LTEQCNNAKKNIDLCKSDLDKKQDERKTSLQNQLAAVDQDEIMDDEDGPQEIIDEDELALLQRMKELKKNYRACYAELKTVKSTCNSISQSIDQSKQKLVGDFEQWYEDNFDINAST
jgi:kinesin family member 6/9